MAVAVGPGNVPILVLSLVGSGDLSAKQFRFVKLSADRTVVICNGATDIPIGVLQNKPTTGQQAEVMAQGVSKVSSDEALTAGWLIGPSADGQADRKVPGTDTTEYVCGQVIKGSGAVAELAEALIDCVAPHRAS